MKGLLLGITFLCVSAILFGQDKILTMEDALVKNRSTLAPDNLNQLQFIYGTNDYVYLSKDDKEWIRGNSTSPAHSFLSLDQLNLLLKKNNYPILKSMPAIQFNKAAHVVMSDDGNKIGVDLGTGKINSIADKNIESKSIVEEM